MGVLEGELRARIAALREEVARLGAPDVRIVGVTKTHPPEVAVAAARVGLLDLGENYAAELVAKAARVGAESSDVRWHFIGQIQRNKLAQVARVAIAIHSLRRVSELERLALLGFSGDVFVQVLPPRAGPGRGGADEADVPVLVEEGHRLGLTVRGLMAVAMPGEEAEVAAFFRRVRRLGESLGLQEFSMGMSEDYRIAVREGATILRLGSAIFGARADGDAHSAKREGSWHHCDG